VELKERNMRKFILIPLMAIFMGCGPEAFLGDVIEDEAPLDRDLQEWVENVLRQRICPKLLANGLDCKIPEQIHSLKLVWTQDQYNNVIRTVQICPKGPCPPYKED